jgi:hypothetical protein
MRYCVKKTLAVCVVSIGVAVNAFAEDIDQSLMIGSWCYTSIAALDSSSKKPVNTQWQFFDDGKVEIQNQWMRDKNNLLGYTVTGDTLAIPKMNKQYVVTTLTTSEMLLTSSRGTSAKLFVKGQCSNSNE